MIREEIENLNINSGDIIRLYFVFKNKPDKECVFIGLTSCSHWTDKYGSRAVVKNIRNGIKSPVYVSISTIDHIDIINRIGYEDYDEEYED